MKTEYLDPKEFLPFFEDEENGAERYLSALGFLRIEAERGPGYLEAVMRAAGIADEFVEEDLSRLKNDAALILGTHVDV